MSFYIDGDYLIFTEGKIPEATCQDAIHIARMYGYPGPSHDDIYPPSDCEPSPPVVETKAAEPLPEDEQERIWRLLSEAAQS